MLIDNKIIHLQVNMTVRLSISSAWVVWKDTLLEYLVHVAFTEDTNAPTLLPLAEESWYVSTPQIIKFFSYENTYIPTTEHCVKIFCRILHCLNTHTKFL